MLFCVRTTLNLDDQLMRQAKEEAARSGRTLTSVVEDALREALSRRAAAPVEPYQVRPFAGSGLCPGVDLNDSAALLDLMDEDA